MKKRAINIFFLWLVYLSPIFLLTVTLGILSISVYTEILAPVTTGNRPAIAKDHFIYDRELGWRLHPNSTVYITDAKGNKTVFFSTNKYGFRNSSFKSIEDRESSVLLLGDSQVQGYFLSDQESISSLLSENLGQQVFNGGVGGYSTDQEYTVLKKLLDIQQFNWVVLFFLLNDLPYLDQSRAWGLPKIRYHVVDGQIDFEKFNLPTFTSSTTTDTNFGVFSANKLSGDDRQILLHGQIERRGPKTLIRNVVTKVSALLGEFPSPTNVFRLMLSMISDTRYRHFVLPLDKDYFDHPEDGVSKYQWNLAVQFFERMRDLTEGQGGSFVVIFVPEIAQIVSKDSVVDYFGDHLTKHDVGEETTKYVGFRPQLYFSELCNLHEISCIDPHKKFLNDSNKDRLYFVNDGHLSPLGSRLMAEIVGSYIDNN